MLLLILLAFRQRAGACYFRLQELHLLYRDLVSNETWLANVTSVTLDMQTKQVRQRGFAAMNVGSRRGSRDQWSRSTRDLWGSTSYGNLGGAKFVDIIGTIRLTHAWAFSEEVPPKEAGRLAKVI